MTEEIDLNYWSQKYELIQKKQKSHMAMEVSNMSHLKKQ